MRLVELKSAIRQGDGARFMAVFEQDGEQITKLLEITHTARIVTNPKDLGAVFRYMLVRKAREAVRDFAFMKYGPEKWKEHVEWGGFFDAPTDEEKRMIEDALIGG